MAKRRLTSVCTAAGCSGAAVESIADGEGGGKVVALSGGATVEADVVIVAIGIRPNTDLAAEAGIETDQGIIVNSRCQTSAEGVYAGGDVAHCGVIEVLGDHRLCRNDHPLEAVAGKQ